MYRARRYWENLNGGDPVTQAIAIVALILFAIFAIPYLPLPYVVSGVGCYNLSSPAISGSSQSILGSQASQNDLRLELVPDPINLKTTDPLNMDVRFINNSMRPLTLFLPQGEYVFRYDEQESGILFSIVGVADGQPRGEGANVRAPFIAPSQFNQTDLHVLGPRQRCSVSVSVDLARLAASRVTPGQYNIIAFYRNTSRGALPPIEANTPTPMFPDAGVWTGTVRSNQITLNYGVAPAAQ
jgi:hypothetical protein